MYAQAANAAAAAFTAAFILPLLTRNASDTDIREEVFVLLPSLLFSDAQSQTCPTHVLA